mmetsp:Transcript_17798/g.37141  ORF Transcript_17798/g.37141 Transcript_17798/m.37141 type:complete len:913 (-) Transcript_17798:754-3492(-)
MPKLGFPRKKKQPALTIDDVASGRVDGAGDDDDEGSSSGSEESSHDDGSGSSSDDGDSSSVSSDTASEDAASASSSSSSSSSGSSSSEEDETLINLIDSVPDHIPSDDASSDDPWEIVRRYLRTHSIAETQAACTAKGEFDTTALHVACRNEPPVDVVDILLMAAPDMIFWADSFGWLPIHYAAANGARLEVVSLLLEAYPDSRLTTDKRGRTPLHFALGNVEMPPAPELVKQLAGKKGESAKWHDENQMLPIHYACAYGASKEVLEVLASSWEEGLSEADGKGRTALHFAMGNADRANSPSLVEMLIEQCPGTMDAVDAENHLPLHLLSAKAATVDESKLEQRDTIQKCLDIYLKADPKPSIEFLTGIQKMPEWLRDVAVIHPTVQTALNSKISSRFPTMILMLDFYFLAATIGSFSLTSLESIERRFNELNTTNADRSVSGALLSPLYIGALYFLLREITQMISVRSQTTVLAYVFDPENMLNLSFVFLTIYYSILMQTGLGNDERFRTGASFTLGICWNQVLAYLKSILIDFAVFVSGVVYVTKGLLSFMICLLITVLAFAQMWYTIFRQSSECAYAALAEEMSVNAAKNDTDTDDVAAVDGAATDDAAAGGGGDIAYDDYFYYDEVVYDCEPNLDYPFCTSMWISIYRTYTMMLGEIDDSVFRWNKLSMILFCIFFLLVLIILLNILIAIITDLHAVITNERAAIVFWSNRLAFITDMDLVTNGPWKKQVQKFFRLNDPENEDDQEDSSLINNKIELSWERILWKKLIECFDPEVDAKGLGVFFYGPLRVFISMFLIPFWLLLGILSAGWLWPPQVREGLFVQKVSMPEDSGQAQESEKRMAEVEELQESLERVQNDLVEEFSADRKEMIELRDQVKAIKKELKDEMKNIKQVMTSLFEVQQRTLVRY